MTGKGIDQNYLVNDQYRNSSNLNARASLHQRFSVNTRGWFPWVFDRFDFPPNSRLLELGSGHGLLWRACIDRVDPSWQITLSDLSPGMIAESEQAISALNATNFTFRQIDAQDIPFDDASFDAVIANHMLYHVPDRAKALHEINRVLKPGGRLFAATVGDGHMTDLNALIRRFDPALLEGNGFAVVGFTLQNAMPEFEAVFPTVRLDWFEDALEVTEVEPLVDYVLSGVRVDQAAMQPRIAAFRGFVADELARGGGMIRIHKESGLFVATK